MRIRITQIIALLSVLITSTIFAPRVFADVAPFGVRCSEFESTVGCSGEQCKSFDSNPKYHQAFQITGVGNNPLTTKLYCYDRRSEHYLQITTLALLVTLILELVVYLIRGYRTTRALSAIFLANLISVPIMQGMGINYSLDFLGIVLLEIVITFFEIVIITLILSDEPKKKLSTTVIIANLLSATIGSAIMYIILKIFFI